MGMKKNTQFLGISSITGLAAYFAAVMPMAAFAQFSGGSLQDVGNDLISFINDTLVPLVFALALIVFIWGLFQSFILGGADPEKRSQGQQLMLWGIIAFFVMVSVWGLVNILVGTFGLENTGGPDLPDVPTQ